MKRISSMLAVVAILSWSAAAIADEGHHTPGEKVVTKTVTGEVVDMGCWLGHAARGKDHISCATKCLNQGMPVGLLTSNGTLYLVTLDHDNADPYNSLKDMAGKDVSITGELLSRSGVKAIEASKVQLASK
jgi:type 1 fimbria pilin